MKRLVLLAVIPFAALAATPLFEPVASNTDTVKGWARRHVTYDEITGEFSDTNFPTRAQAVTAKAVAESVPAILQDSIDLLNAELEPVGEALDEHLARPVCMLVAAASPDNAVDRQNLTLVSLSNEITRTESGVHVEAWLFGNTVLTSKPVMKGRVLTNLGASEAWFPATWTDGYGTNGVTVVRDGEDFETYRIEFDIPGEVSTNLTVYLNPWVGIGTPTAPFDYGNRQRRVNGVMCATTNDLSFLGRFYTTNGTEIAEFTPYADRGKFRFAAKEDNE